MSAYIPINSRLNATGHDIATLCKALLASKFCLLSPDCCNTTLLALPLYLYMMEWKRLLTPQRLGKSKPEDIQFDRTCFQKDYDRLIFSSSFRRLKDKTQVFSLPKNDYIRTRLIHSLEVSCVGRSLGRIVGHEIVKRHQLDICGFSAADFGDIVSTASIAHDIGNPPFGHSGEDAIRLGFTSWYRNNNDVVEGLINKSQKTDFDLFEGNAQGFRILTKLEIPSKIGGMQLTCPALAAFAKYPRESNLPQSIINEYTGVSIKKNGFFQAEKNVFNEVATIVGLIRRHPDYAWWSRHPLAFLMEAADDICYSIVDIEDAFRMGFISFFQVEELLNEIADIDISEENVAESEKVKRLRAKSINKLVREAADIFLSNELDILAGKFDQNLLSLSRYTKHLKLISKITRDLVFQHPDVVGMRIAGYEVLGKLFAEFVDSVLQTTPKGELVGYMLPTKYRPLVTDDTYHKILRVTDYISGMTDYYATNLFQKLSGISLR